jgi:hypothetical protein
MSFCWYCYWGWPKQVADIYARAVADLDGDSSPLEFGPSHIVWSDENFEESNIRYCLGACDDPKQGERYSDHELTIVRRSLAELLAIPESIRCCEPADYDEERPANFPPPAGLEMVKR